MPGGGAAPRPSGSDVPVARVSQGSGVGLLTDAEIGDDGRPGRRRRRRAEPLRPAVRRRGTPRRWPAHPAGPWSPPSARGQDQLVAVIDEIRRAADLGVRSVLVSDIGVLAVFGAAARGRRAAGRHAGQGVRHAAGREPGRGPGHGRDGRRHPQPADPSCRSAPTISSSTRWRSIARTKPSRTCTTRCIRRSSGCSRWPSRTANKAGKADRRVRRDGGRGRSDALAAGPRPAQFLDASGASADRQAARADLRGRRDQAARRPHPACRQPDKISHWWTRSTLTRSPIAQRIRCEASRHSACRGIQPAASVASGWRSAMLLGPSRPRA